jgi:acetyl-CoA synthetase
MNLMDRYLERTSFTSYEDFAQNLRILVPGNFNFAYDVIDEYARLEPERLALVWCDDHGGDMRFTFTEMKRLSDKAANLLVRLGVKKGDRVMLMLRRRHEFYTVAFALAKIGAVYIPSTNQLTEKDLEYRNNAASVKMIIAYGQEDIIRHVEAAGPASPTVETLVLVGGSREGWVDFDAEMENAPSVWDRPAGLADTQNDDPMIIYFTSGTTAMPKMAMHPFTYPLGHIVTARYWQQVQDGGLHLTLADSGWAKFGWGKLYGQWICGAVQFVYDMDRFDPAALLGKISHYRLTTFCAPPTIYRFLLQQDLSQYDLTSLRHCSTAGEPLNADVFNRFLHETGLQIYNGFGQSETTVLVHDNEWMTIQPGSMGMPNPAYRIDIVDENCETCAPGVEGELVIRDADSNRPVGLFTGYFQDEEVTRRVWHDDVYHTGDVAYRDEHGLYWFIGRNDDVIKASGYRISPFEVESAVIAHPAVVECAVTGSPDSLRGIVVKATVVLAKGHEPSEELKKDIQEFVKKLTAPYKYPRVLEFVDELPKTIGGKIKRAQIRREDQSKYMEK